MNKKLLILIIGGFIVGLGLAWFLTGGFRYPWRGGKEVEGGKEQDNLFPSSTIKKNPNTEKNGGDNSGSFKNDLSKSFSEPLDISKSLYFIEELPLFKTSIINV